MCPNRRTSSETCCGCTRYIRSGTFEQQARSLTRAIPLRANGSGARIPHNPRVSPDSLRVYADRGTQDAFDIWNAGAAHVARMVTESALEIEALRDKLKAIACSS